MISPGLTALKLAATDGPHAGRVVLIDGGVQITQGGAAIRVIKEVAKKWALVEGRTKVARWLIDEGLERFGKALEFPFSPSEAIDAIICGSILLYSYRLDQMSGGPVQQGWRVVGGHDIWHRQADRTDRLYQWQAEVHLRFDFVINRLEPGSISMLSCKNLPEAGNVANQPIEWKTDPALAFHGTLRAVDPDRSGAGPSVRGLTDKFGVSMALFTAVDEKAPPERRKQVRTAQGRLLASARGLVPGYEMLELVVRDLRARAGAALPLEAAQMITVNYFEWPRDFRNSEYPEFTVLKCNEPSGEWSLRLEGHPPYEDYIETGTFTLDERTLKGSYRGRAEVRTKDVYCWFTILNDVSFDEGPPLGLHFENYRLIPDNPALCGNPLGNPMLSLGGYFLPLEEGEFCISEGE